MTRGKYYESGTILPKEQRRVLMSNELVQDLLNAEFKTEKKRQGEKEESIDRAYFCVKCKGRSLTKSEVAEFHEGHRILRAMKCSGSYGYVNKEIVPIFQDIIHDIDLSEIYEFKINVYNIYFPKCRKKNDDNKINSLKMNKGRCCIKCMHTLPEGYSFCSIECKITCTSDDLQRHHDWKQQQLIQNQNQVTLPSKKMKRTAAGNNNINMKKKKIDLEGLATIVIIEEADGKKLSHHFGHSYRKRSRKGVPRRAPLY